MTDAERLRLALVNILTNAKHAVAAADSSQADRIRVITAMGPEGRVVIQVLDRGVGITQEDLSRIFDPFFTTRGTGTGLGLAITRNIIEGWAARSPSPALPAAARMSGSSCHPPRRPHDDGHWRDPAR